MLIKEGGHKEEFQSSFKQFCLENIQVNKTFKTRKSNKPDSKIILYLQFHEETWNRAVLHLYEKDVDDFISEGVQTWENFLKTILMKCYIGVYR